MKALEGTFNQEKALVGALSMIVKLQYSRSFVCSSNLKGYRPVMRAALLGVQVGSVYSCSSLVPPDSIACRCGVAAL